MPFSVVVSFKIKPEVLQVFMPLMHANARASLRDEAGCSQFDVATDPDTPGDVFLYEVYDDEAAYQAHLVTAHFNVFYAAAADMIAHKHMRTYREVAQ